MACHPRLFASLALVLSCRCFALGVTHIRGTGAGVGDAQSRARDASLVDVSLGADGGSRTLASLLDVEQDLQAEQQTEVQDLTNVDKQIAKLMKQREGMRKGKARRGREMNFLSTEIGRLRKKFKLNEKAGRAEAAEDLTMNETAMDAQETTVDAKASATVDVAADATANAEAEVTADATAEKADSKVETDVQSKASVDNAALVSSDAAVATDRQQSQMMTRAQAEAEAKAQASSDAAVATDRQQSQMMTRAQAEAEAKVQAKAQQQAQAAAVAAAVAAAMKAQAESDAKAQAKAKAEAAAAEAAARAKAEAEARAKAETEAAARAKAEAEAKAAAAAEDAKEKKKNELADHADDSFNDFMKEEDGEDEQNDPEYEDSANALAGAIGWNRKDVEKNADVAVKSLTEAIGGKKVVRALQGMMAGVAR